MPRNPSTRRRPRQDAGPETIDVLSNRYGNDRAGVNDRERSLSNKDNKIDPLTFGKLFTRTVDGDLYAQPLIVSGVKIKRKRRNVVYLATSRNWVYAYDADDPLAFEPLWTRQLGTPVPRQAIEATYGNFGSEIGITSTPAIDRVGRGGTIFVVAKTMDGPDPTATFAHRLHALDILTGRDRLPAVAIEAEVPGRPSVRFVAKLNLNRPGLLLLDGVVYLAFGSHDDSGTYYGWIMAYDAVTLKQLAAYCTAPDWGAAGVWQSGTGLAGDEEGHVYAVVGNGRSPKDTDYQPKFPQPTTVAAPVYGNCMLKLRLDKEKGELTVVSWFTTSNVFDLNANDTDLVGGPVLFEGSGPPERRRNFVLGGGKDGYFYLADRKRLGGWTERDNQGILQAAPLCAFHIHGAPVIWRKDANDVRAYVWSEKDALKGYQLGANGFDITAFSTSEYRLPVNEYRMPGGFLSLSWDGTDPKTAVLWAAHSTRDDAMNRTVAGTLRAYDPLDLNTELWTSDMDPWGEDRLGMLAKFSSPVVANGKVYVGTFSRELVVYGVLKERLYHTDLGDFELRQIGDDLIPTATFKGGKYDLRLSGAGIGGAVEGYLLACCDKSPQDAPVTVTATIVGINAPDYQEAAAGVIVRRGFDPVDGMAGLMLQGNAVILMVREQASPANTPATEVGRLPVAATPVRLRLTVRAIDDKPGQVLVTGETVDIATGNTASVIGSRVVTLDATANITLKAGFFATAQASRKVQPTAFPAWARFANVQA